MLHGDFVVLREVRRSDLDVLHGAFESDPAMHAVVNESPWRPSTVGRRKALFDAQLAADPDPTFVTFAVQRRDDPQDRCLGTGTVWGIDVHNRTAHIGVQLVAAARGRGLGREVVMLLCEYAFVHRGLYRVQLETLGSNVAMRQVAVACGFAEEGCRRQAAFVTGRREDEVVYGVLEHEWVARKRAAEAT